ncbi:uncharacterized protein LOC117926621 [Vitis riparia]|uniref:uncharacterized protein LOC117926621 n=1 Tax=Vitis riparia TaxID=96939 RepID=UPI00155A1D2E|nr:uncharacterized protein LOC117926621 [Vitis riparia]
MEPSESKHLYWDLDAEGPGLRRGLHRYLDLDAEGPRRHGWRHSYRAGPSFIGNNHMVTMERDRALRLNRVKDVLCLILSYPPFSSAIKKSHEGWILDVLAINQKLREAVYRKKEIDVSELSPRISLLLDHSIHDIEAYVRPEFIEKMQRGTEWGRTPTTKVYNLAIDFAFRQILQVIEIPKFQRILISGRDDAGLLTSRLKNLQQEKEMFDLVIHVKASSCKSARDIEDVIARELGLSTSSRQEVDGLLQSKSFLILLDDVDLASTRNLNNVGTNWWNSKKFQKMVCTTCSMGRRADHTEADLEIRLEDHLFTWELFCREVGDVVHFSGIQHLAIRMVKECKGHLLVIVLMATALRDIDEVHTWECASLALTLQPTQLRDDDVLFNALAFVCGRLGSAMNCLKYLVEMGCWGGLKEGDLIGRWITDGLISTVDEGKERVRHLVDAFLFKRSWNRGPYFVRMHSKIHEVLLNMLGPKRESLFLWLGGKGLTEPPRDEAWEKASEVHLMNNKLSELPKSPHCPKLRALFLQANHGLRVIPPIFFEEMPSLQFLDLSNTTIRSLPPSLFELVQLRIFLLRGCQLLMELPSQVGNLINLEVLDLEGTEIISLPVNIKMLTNLKCLRVSFYGYSDQTEQNNQSSDTMIPCNVLSELTQLEELGIHVNPDDKRWDANMEVVKEVGSFKHLETLKLYLPEVILVNEFMGSGTSTRNLSLMNFRFIIGSHRKRFVSRLPQEIAVKFEQQERCLKYVNGEGIPMEIKKILEHATALLLERHLTLTKLSEFGIENTMKLEFCVLGECSKIQTLVDGAENYRQGDDDGDVHQKMILGSLQYLRLHYLKNLGSIWKGPISKGCLSSLKSLELYACPQLKTIFTLALLENLNRLEELVVENCPKINSLVTHEVPAEDTLLKTYLLRLKKISLHYLPKLASISSGLRIAPGLKWMSFYNCPSIEALSNMEVSSNNLKVIIGEVDWWRALKWRKPVLRRKLDSIFLPIKSDADLMTQLVEIGNQRLAPKQERNPSQQSGSDDSLKPPVVDALKALAVEALKALAMEAGTTSVDKQRHEPSPLPLLPPSTKSSLKATVVEAGTTSEQTQLSEPTPQPLLSLSTEQDTVEMADAAEVDLHRVGRSLLTSVSSIIAFPKDLTRNYKMLTEGAEELKALKYDILEGRGHKKSPAMREWMDQAEMISKEVNELEAKYNDEMEHPWRLVHFWEHSYLSKVMVKKHNQVQSLLEEGHDKRRVWIEELPEPVRKIRAAKIEDNSSLHKVVEDVVSFLEDEQIRRIGIWGTVGTGKTTVMQNLNNHQDIAKMFDIVIWVTVSKESSTKKLQDAIMQRLKMNMEGTVSIKENSHRISEELKGRKCLILLDEVHDFIDLHVVMGINDNQESKVVLASTIRGICNDMEADELINVKPLSDHEAFNMFKEKLGWSIYSPEIEQAAEHVVRECGGLPLLINIVAMILRNKGEDISLWIDGLKHLQRWEDIVGMDQVIEFLNFCYDYLDSDTKKACYLYCSLFPGEYDINVDYLLECWKAEGFTPGTVAFRDARHQGHVILDDLINLSLLERSGKGKCVKMNRILRKTALKISLHSDGSKFLAKPCEGLQDFPDSKEWEDASRISLMNNQLCTLPKSPSCHNLSTLLLQRNNGLSAIPPPFFNSMHLLRVLDLHGTGIILLPSSISKLIHLRALYLDSCPHLIGPLPEIRALTKLELLDIRGTKIPFRHIGSLIWLKCLRISLSSFSMGIKLGSISAFVSLEEFCVDDDVSVEKHSEDLKDVTEEVITLEKLTYLQFCFPSVDVLSLFVLKSPAWKNTSFSFQFSVGYQDSTYSHFLESCDYRSLNCLKLVIDEGMHPVIAEVLMVTDAFGLSNHKGASALSDFGIQNMKNVLVCSVEGCNEISSIICGDGIANSVLENLDILYIKNVPKLRSIWQGPVPEGSLAQLTTLTLTKCPELKKIFSNGMIQQLSKLQHLRVEECHQIEEIIMDSENQVLEVNALPRLKTIILIDLPKLRSIWVDDSLEWPSLQRIQISMCYMLRRLPFNNTNATRLRHIEGQQSWWEALEWEDDATKQRLQSLCILN